jgi:hypothetical protein
MWRVCVQCQEEGKKKAINRLVLLTITRPEKIKENSFSYALNDDDMTNFFGGAIIIVCVYIQSGHKSRRATGHHLNSLMRQ